MLWVIGLFTSWFGTNIGPMIGKIVFFGALILLPLGILAGTYYVGESHGEANCQLSHTNAAIAARDQEIANLKAQKDNLEKTITQFNSQQKILVNNYEHLLNEVPTVIHDKPECTQGQGAVDLINKARGGHQ